MRARYALLLFVASTVACGAGHVDPKGAPCACGSNVIGSQGAPSAATTIPTTPTTQTTPPTAPTTPTTPPANDLVGQVTACRLTLVEGIRRIEKEHGAALSAGFELVEGKLVFRAFVAKLGLEKDNQHNAFLEVTADPTAEPWQSKESPIASPSALALASSRLDVLRGIHATLIAAIEQAITPDWRDRATFVAVTPQVAENHPAKDGVVAVSVKMTTTKRLFTIMVGANDIAP